MNETTLTYQEMTLSSRELIVPSSSYQRPFRPEHAMAITNKFDEHLANEPKVSYRGGNYYVFDGQHTIAARKNLNGGNDVLVKCKVYYDLTEEDEALLFAQQFGESSALTAGIRMRALVFGKDPEALAFVHATEAAAFIWTSTRNVAVTGWAASTPLSGSSNVLAQRYTPRRWRSSGSHGTASHSPCAARLSRA